MIKEAKMMREIRKVVMAAFELVTLKSYYKAKREGYSGGTGVKITMANLKW
ncbi:hypothetical protein ES703_124774 [subsurface metagenome]